MRLSVQYLLIVLADPYSACSAVGGLGRACVVSWRGVLISFFVQNKCSNLKCPFVRMYTCQSERMFTRNLVVHNSFYIPDRRFKSRTDLVFFSSPTPTLSALP